MNNITMALNADELILSALREDITSEDITTNSVMREYQKGEVDLICKQDGIICGLQVFERVFTLLDESTKVQFFVQDGDAVKAGQLMAKVHGDIRTLLCGERTALNYLQRMSGIATYTHEVASLLAGSKTKLLDTRKTTPNNRIFEKYAVRTGGGNNHRYNLSDGVLLKDNHIGAAGGVKEAIAAAKEYAPFVRKIEVEVENQKMVEEAVEAGADIITFHLEAAKHPHRIIQAIHAAGCKAGISINPGTPLCMLEELLAEVDLVLLMSVNPGYGGQKFIPSVLDKVGRLKAAMLATDCKAELEVDGGVTLENAQQIIDMGADVLVAGSAVYGAEDVEAAIKGLHGNV